MQKSACQKMYTEKKNLEKPFKQVMPKLRPEGSPGTIEYEWEWAKLEETGCLKGQRIKGHRRLREMNHIQDG